MMRVVLAEEFLEWAGDRKVGLDARSPEPRCLVYHPPRDISRFWIVPETPSVWPYFIGCLLDGIEPWTSCHLWFRGGCWPDLEKPFDDNEKVRSILFRGLGIPSNLLGAIEFERGERDALISIVFVQLAFGWCVDDDLFVIPDHATTFLRVGHHEAVWVNFERKGLVGRFVEHMKSKGYDLPSATPDWTFKKPRWMKRKSDSTGAGSGDGAPPA